MYVFSLSLSLSLSIYIYIYIYTCMFVVFVCLLPRFVHNCSKVVQNGLWMVPNTPQTLLGYFWDKSFFEKRSKDMKRPDFRKPICVDYFLKSRPHTAPQSEPTSGQISYIDPLSIRSSSIFSERRSFTT